MRTEKLLAAGLILAGATSLALAQRGTHHGSGSGQIERQQSVEYLQRKARVQATAEQRVRLRNCLEMSRFAQTLSTELKNAANLSGTALERKRQSSQIVRWGVQSGHEAFLGSLTPDQETGLKDRLRKLDKTWSELSTRFDKMDQDLAQSPPDAKLVVGHAKELQKSLKKWQEQHRELGSEMGVSG